MHRIHFWSGLCPRPRWRSLRRSIRPLRMGRAMPPPHTSPPRCLWRLDLGVLKSVPNFYHGFMVILHMLECWGECMICRIGDPWTLTSVVTCQPLLLSLVHLVPNVIRHCVFLLFYFMLSQLQCSAACCPVPNGVTVCRTFAGRFGLRGCLLFLSEWNT